MERFGVMMCNGVTDVPHPPVTLVRTSVKTPRAAKWCVTFGRLLNPLLLVSTGRGEKRGRRSERVCTILTLYLVSRRTALKQNPQYVTLPILLTEWITICVCSFSFKFLHLMLMWICWMQFFFFFIPNSHGFMGKERLNKQTNKLETMTALHLLTPAFPDETLPS